MTEHQIASAIENYVTSHEGVTDFSVAIEQIKDEIDTLRIRMFDEQDLNSRFTISLEPFVQKIESTDVLYDPITKSTTVLIPDIHIRQNGKAAIRYCGSQSYKTPFRVVTGNHHLYATHDQFIGNAPLAHYEFGKITFKNTNLKKVLIIALFTDPSKLVSYGYDEKVSRYPVPTGLTDMIIGKTAESYIRTMYRIPLQPNTQADSPVNARS
jgi:hypothetical protein